MLAYLLVSWLGASSAVPAACAQSQADKTATESKARSSRRLDRPLKGYARKEFPGRMERPALETVVPVTVPGREASLHANLNESSFDLGAGQTEKPKSAVVGATNQMVVPLEAGKSEPAWLTPLQATATSQTTPGAVDKGYEQQEKPGQTPRTETGSGGGSEPASAETKKKETQGKVITIRLKRFRSLIEMEVVWEAVTLANKMLQKGAEVTILLDMEAVNAANRSDTNFTEFELHRGQKNDRFTSIQQLLRDFLTGGGHVLVSERWWKIFSIPPGQLTGGAQLVSDDDIADHLLTTGNILDF